jgi:HSP20 family molecular chaperone IbpA
MWAEACQTLARTERLRSRFFEVEADSSGGSPAWQAPVDIFESGRDLVVWIALPGVAPESVEIGLDDATLRVTGVRRLRVESPTAAIRRLEIPHGRLERRIELPAPGYALVTCDAADGCLRLRLRRS